MRRDAPFQIEVLTWHTLSNLIEVRTYPKTALGEGLPTPPKTPTEGLPRLSETFGRTEWLGRETGHSDKRPLAMAK